MTAITEGLRQAKERFADTGRLPAEAVQALAAIDPSPTKKYVEWLCAQYEKYLEGIGDALESAAKPGGLNKVMLRTGPYRVALWRNFYDPHGEAIKISMWYDVTETIESLILKYHDLSTRNLMGGLNDINAFEDTKSLMEAVAEAQAELKRAVRRRAVPTVRANTKKIFDNDLMTIVAPVTHEQAMAWGTDTDWCISAESENGEGYWNKYFYGVNPEADMGDLQDDDFDGPAYAIYMVISKHPEGTLLREYVKLAFLVGDGELIGYDRDDTEYDDDGLEGMIEVVKDMTDPAWWEANPPKPEDLDDEPGVRGVEQAVKTLEFLRAIPGDRLVPKR